MTDPLRKLANLYRLRNALLAELASRQSRADFPILSEDLICTWHRILLEGVGESPGRYWPGRRWLGKSSHTPPEGAMVPLLMADFCRQVAQMEQANDPVATAAYGLWRLLWIHPFADGNGRVARAICHFILRATQRQPAPLNLVLDPLIADYSRYIGALEDAHVEHREHHATPRMVGLTALVAETYQGIGG